MAGQHGGKRRPNRPAPVSGPGSLSRRTDGGPAQPARYVSGLPYGEGQEFMDLQSSAPMSASPTAQTPTMRFSGASEGSPSLVPLSAPTQRLDEPVTAGADAGPGPDSGVLGLGNAESTDMARAAAQMTEYMPALLFLAAQPTTSPETRNLIRRLREIQ